MGDGDKSGTTAFGDAERSRTTTGPEGRSENPSSRRSSSRRESRPSRESPSPRESLSSRESPPSRESLSSRKDPSPRETPSQTAGPYLHIGLTPHAAGIAPAHDSPSGTPDPGASVCRGPLRGESIDVRIRVFDGDGQVLTDAVVELWQADADGLFASPLETRGTPDPGFTGWARRAADPESGELAFETIRPGRVPWRDGRPQAPHVTLWIVARGINVGLHTRMYFEDETAANAEDPVLERVEPASRVGTLLARRDGEGRYRFDIRLQGEEETVFLDV